MASPLELAIMSEQVYEDNPYGGRPPSGWEKLHATNSADPTWQGYHACAYYNHQSKALVIAHRGTQITNAAHIQSDLQILQQQEPQLRLHAQRFMQQIAARNVQASSILHTGHSLGAVLAQLCAIDDGCTAVVFDSPGCKQMLLNYAAGRGQPLPQIQHYLSDPNTINCWHDHVGEIYHVDVVSQGQRDLLLDMHTRALSLTPDMAIDYAMTGKIGFLQALTSLAYPIIEISSFHSITGFVKAFQRGVAPQQLTLEQWRQKTLPSALAVFLKTYQEHRPAFLHFTPLRRNNRFLGGDDFSFKLKVQHWVKAKREFDTNPESAEKRLELAQSYFFLNDTQNAVLLLQAMPLASLMTAELLCETAQLYELLSGSDQALAVLDHAHQAISQHPQLLEKKADYLMILHREAEAITVLNQMPSPHSEAVFKKRIECFLALQQYTEALNVTRDYAHFYPNKNTCDIYIKKALCYFNLQQYDVALERLLVANHACPNSRQHNEIQALAQSLMTPILSIATQHISQQQYDQALKKLTSLRLLLTQLQCQACVDIARCYFHLGQYVNAATAVRQARGLNPDTNELNQIRSLRSMVAEQLIEQARLAIQSNQRQAALTSLQATHQLVFDETSLSTIRQLQQTAQTLSAAPQLAQGVQRVYRGNPIAHQSNRRQPMQPRVNNSGSGPRPR